MSFPWFTEKQRSNLDRSDKSSRRRFFSSRLNIALVVLVIILATTLAFVLAFVTIPDLKHQTTSSNSSDYAVIPKDFPDPAFIQDYKTGIYYAFGTRNTKVNVQVATANNISSWILQEDFDALPHPGDWAATSINDTQVWAPTVTSTVSGTYIMFYSALHMEHTKKHCIGAATSTTIKGPYTALPSPIVCDFEHGGVIDPAYFHDPGTNTSYLVYKQDGNTIGVGGACSNGKWPNTPTPLMAVALSADDLTTPVGSPFQLLTNIQSDGPNIESPMLYYHEQCTSSNCSSTKRSYHLLYSSGCYHDSSYKIEHIVCIPSSENAYTTSGITECQWQANRSKAKAVCVNNCTTTWAGTILHSNLAVDVGTVNLTATLNNPDPDTWFKQSGNTKLKVMAPGGPAICASTQGGIGDGNVNKQYLAFHADTNMAYFKHPRTQPRVRAMFIAELEYDSDTMDVRVKGLVKPD